MSNKIKMSAKQWLMAGINDGSLIINHNGGITLNREAFAGSSDSLKKVAQSWAGGQFMPGAFGDEVNKGLATGTLSGIPGYISTPQSATQAYSRSLLSRIPIGSKGSAAIQQSLMDYQGQSLVTPPATGGLMRAAPTTGVRMGLKQPFSAGAAEFAAARGAGSGRTMATLTGLKGGIKAVPGGLSTAGKGLAGAAMSGGVRGFLAANFVSAVGSIAAWGVHKGLLATYDWSRGANEISGNLRTPKGAQGFAKAQELLSSKVMPMMHGQAAAPGQKLDALNGYISDLAKQLESDPGYQAAISGQIPQQSAETMPEDLSTPGINESQLNPYNL